MLYRLFIMAVALAAAAPALRAGDLSAPASDTAAVGTATSGGGKVHLSYELDADVSFTGGASMDIGRSETNLSEIRSRGHLVVGAQPEGGPIYRFGLAYSRYSFGFSRAAPFSNVLEAETLVLGVDLELFNSWVVRIEADPGFYGDSRGTGWRTFNCPFTIGGSYITGADVQWVLGMEVDLNRQIPILPAIGVRWAFYNQWVLDAILPTPRLEYEYSKSLTLYVGGDVDDNTYRVDHGVGTAIRQPKVSNGVVEYSEIRVGGGLSWKAAKGVTLELEGGVVPFREFDYHRAGVHFSTDATAPYCQFSLNAQF